MRNLAAAFLFLCSTSAFAEPLSAITKKWTDLQPGETKNSQGFTVTVGHATFTASTVMTILAGDQAVGLFLGPGTFTYESADTDEHPALRYNAKALSIKLQSGGGKLILQESFKTALLLGNGLQPPSGEGTGTAPDWAAHRELFARNVLATPPAHLFAYQALDAPAARVVRAEINGVSRPFVYAFDDALDHMETLNYLQPSKQHGSKLGNFFRNGAVSRQAIGRDHRDAPPARIRLVDVDVTLAGKMNEEGTMSIVETLVPQLRPAAAIHFDLTSDYWYDLSRDPRRYNLRRVVDGEGRELDFVHENDDLVVALAKPAPVGQPLKLRFEIDGNFLFRQDKTNFWELGIYPWFPWLGMHEQSYTFHAVVRTEKPFVAFASGKTVRRGEEGDYNVVETKLDQPVGWVAILGGKYQFEEETRNGVTIRVASFMVKNKDAFRKLRNLAFAAIDYYPLFLGPFPYDELNVIEKADFLGYGQAPAGIVFISSEAFQPILGDDNNDYVEGVNMRFAHEIAHAYWGGVVRMATPREQWIDEAFAEYSAALFMKMAKPAWYQRAFAQWKSNAKDFVQHGSIPTANQLSHPTEPIDVFRIRQALIYDKGALLLGALHQELGDNAFLTFMKSYQKNFRGKYGSTKNVMGLLQFMTKKDYGPWFEENFYGTALPDVKPLK